MVNTILSDYEAPAQPTLVRDVDGDNERIAANLYEAINPDGPPWARLESNVAERWRRAVQGLSDLSAQLLGVAQPVSSRVDVADMCDRLVAISSAVADQDDRAAQSMIGECLRLLKDETALWLAAAPEAPAQEKQ